MLVPVVRVPPSPLVMLLEPVPLEVPGVMALHVLGKVPGAHADRPLRKSAHLAKLGLPTGLPSLLAVSRTWLYCKLVRRLCFPSVRERWSPVWNCSSVTAPPNWYCPPQDIPPVIPPPELAPMEKPERKSVPGRRSVTPTWEFVNGVRMSFLIGYR